MSEGRGILPEWRYWPAVPLAAMFVVAILGISLPVPPPQNNPIAAASKKPDEKPQQIDPNERLANYTFYLTIFSGVLAAFGGLEIWLLFSTDRTARRAAKTATQQTAILAAQTDILTKQKEIARQEYLTVHRPRITVRALKPHMESTKNRKYLVEFLILNEGETDAEISEIGTAVFSGPGPWTYGARKIRFDVEKKTLTLVGGQTESILTKAGFPMIESDPIPSRSRGIYWFCVGYIKYRGASDTFDRATGFCRTWDFETMTWERWPSEEHEYAY